jgi:hypothetical protein
MLKRSANLATLGFLLSLVGYASTAQADNYVNSMSYARTKNFMDGGKTYEYKLDTGVISMRINSGTWQALPRPELNMLFKNIAADNNRLFALTTDNRFFWFLPKTDYAGWVVNMCQAACDLNWSWLNDRLSSFLDGHNACEYKDFTVNAHTVAADQPGKWNELLRLDGISQRGYPGPNDTFDRNTVIDIAVGHWYGTVVTYYLLVKTAEGAKIMFTDEEPLLPKWVDLAAKDEYLFPKPLYNGTEVENYGLKYTKFYDNYELQDGPASSALTEESRIDASNSVLAVSTRVKDTNDAKLWWIRFDFHHQDLFNFWPVLDWTETRWKSATFAGGNPTRFSINTNGSHDPSMDQGPWKKPHFKFCWVNIGATCWLSSETSELKGMLGSIERWDVYNYPLALTIATSPDKATTYSNQRTHRRCYVFPKIKWLRWPCKMQAIGLLDNFLDGDITFDNFDDHSVGPTPNQDINDPLRYDREYEFINWDLSWTKADESCRKHGQTLAMPRSTAALNFVGAVAGPPVHTWIGLSYNYGWYWSDGTLLSPPGNWAPGQPDNSGGNEIYVETVSTGKWNDLPSTWDAKYICEKPDTW